MSQPTATELAARQVHRMCPELAVYQEILDMLGLSNPPTRGPEKVRCYGPRPISHGTIGGYKTHYRRGENPCVACKVAQRRYRAGLRRLHGQPPRGHRPIRHGTPGGYRAHRRRGEDPCDSCTDAERVYRSQLRHTQHSRRNP